MILLPFSKRTTTAVTVFACLQVAKTTQTFSTLTVPQINALQLEAATLFSVYRQIIHQDTANQAAVLADVIGQAATVIEQLNATMQSITPLPVNPDQLIDLQLVAMNAVQVMQNVQAVEGE
jgi:hypothetical protein